MRGRDLSGILAIIFFAYILFSKTGVSSVFTKSLRIKAIVQISCWGIGPLYSYCHYDPGSLKVEVGNSGFSIEPFSIITHESKVSFEASVITPSGKSITQTKTLSFSEPGWKTVTFSFPLKEIGTYQYDVKVCGNYYGIERCDERRGIYTYTGD